MKDRLPEHIEPLQLVRSGRVLEGKLPLSRMERLLDTVDKATGDARVELNFVVNSSDMPCIQGHVETEVGLLCQRCMQDMTWPINNQFELLIVESEAEADRLGEDVDVLLLGDQLVSVSELIEDEILLGLPIVPKHAAGTDCANALSADEAAEDNVKPVTDSAEEAETENEAKENPFAVLAGLKNRKD